MHDRNQSWSSFEIQVYVNEREWFAKQLDKDGNHYERYESALLEFDLLEAAERLVERLRHRE